MTAEYALLEEHEQGQLQKTTIRKSSKRWYIIGFTTASITLVIVGLLVFFQQRGVSTRESDEQYYDLEQTPPARFIDFSVPNLEHPFYVDLDKYPVEDQLLQLFPTAASESIRQYTIKKLAKEPTSNSWTQEWLSHPNDTKFDCDNQALPYPILRRMVSEYLPVKDFDRFFEDTAIDFSNPFILLPFTQAPNQLKPGQQICVRVVVPYTNVSSNNTHHLLYRPYPKYNADINTPWWDTMMTSLTDETTKASIAIHMEPWKGHHQLRQRARELNHVNLNIPEWTRLREDEIYERERMHIYEAQVTIPQQSGHWQLTSILEFVQAQYNFEFGPITPYHPIELPVFPSGAQLWKVEAQDDDLLTQHLALPLCKGFGHRGRWLPFPANSTQQVLGLTRDNKFWAPYECHYRHISYEQFNRCAAKKYPRGMDLYGDSNIRRSIKKFISHGQWCKDWHKFIKDPLLPEDQKPQINRTLVSRQVGYASPQEWQHLQDEQTRSCYCEDFSEPLWNTEWFNPMSRRSNLVYDNSEEQARLLGVTEWDDNKTTTKTDRFPVSSYKWDGLTYLNIPPWQEAVPSSPPQADIAIFSLGNWDAAFGELEPFLRDVDYLIRQIKAHYDLTKTKIIYRTAQYYCCRIDVSDRTRQISGPRLDVFENEAIRMFKDELHAEIWDTYTLAESKTFDEKMVAITCPSNHVPADQVEIENQLLMNGLCNL
jgi:hypothetical protein